MQKKKLVLFHCFLAVVDSTWALNKWEIIKLFGLMILSMKHVKLSGNISAILLWKEILNK